MSLKQQVRAIVKDLLTDEDFRDELDAHQKAKNDEAAKKEAASKPKQEQVQ